MMPSMTSTSSDSARTFGTIGVIGLGTMGAGIAEVFARNGFSVVGVEQNDEGLTRGRQHLEHSTGRAVKRGKMSEAEQAELLGRVTFTTEMKDLVDADLVVEAVIESLEVKKGILRELDGIVGPDTILATNTSSLSVTEISTATSRPGHVIGVHFFNPAPVQNLVEIIRTVVTEQAVLDDVKALVEKVGKNPVVCGDKAGFIANTLLFGYLNHAVSMFENHYATREDIDAAMRFGCGYPMGPLALLDLIGLDTAYEILETMYRQSRDHRHAPAVGLIGGDEIGRIETGLAHGARAHNAVRGRGGGTFVADSVPGPAPPTEASPPRSSRAGSTAPGAGAGDRRRGAGNAGDRACRRFCRRQESVCLPSARRRRHDHHSERRFAATQRFVRSRG